MMAVAGAARLTTRLTGVRRRLGDAGIPALLVTHLPNVFYLTGFAGTAGAVLVTADRISLIADSRYTLAARAAADRAAAIGLTVVPVATSYEVACRDLVKASGARRVGIEASHVTLDWHDWMTAALAPDGIELHRTRGLVEAGRIRKDPEELAVLREAGRRISAVMTDAFTGLRPGQTELEVAGEIDRAIRVAGFERPAFDTIVASGPRTALPHARPGDRRLARGDLVLLDFGGVFGGYCVDITRMASLGPPRPEAVRWHEAVDAARHAAIETVRPAALTTAVDGAARSALAARGLAEAFGHGTGHGLGIEVHEAPRVGRRQAPPGEPDPHEVALEAGMVITVEPGVYLAGEGGVRIEDDVAVTDEGHELLTTAPRDLVVVG